MITTMNFKSTTLGTLIKQWRAARSKSQLALALHAGVSARHLSFVESGRASPSREFIVTIANALDVPLRERNAMFLAAGYAPMYSQQSLTSDDFGRVRFALDRLLAHQEPYPAVLLDRHWNVLQANRAAPKLFALFMDTAASATPSEPPNLLRTMFSDSGMRPSVANWDVVSQTLVKRVYREAVGGVPDAETLNLLHEIGAPANVMQDVHGDTEALLPFIPIVLRKPGLELSFFSMIMSVGAPTDVTAQELRIECLFPSNDFTEQFARATF